MQIMHNGKETRYPLYHHPSPPLPLTTNPRFNTCVEPPAGIRRSDESQSSGVANNFLAAPRPTARVGIPVAVAAAAIAPRPSLSPT
jgi:hypothetical protein